MSRRIDRDKLRRQRRARRAYDPVASFQPSYSRKQWRKHRKSISALRRKGGVR